MKSFWDIWDRIAVAGTFALALTLTGGLVYATLSGHDRQMFIFNDFNEQMIEAVAFPIVCLMMGVTVWRKYVR